MGMIRAMRRTTFTLAIACGLFVVGALATPASAANVTFTLYVSDTDGWGFTNTSLSIPGPTLTVEQGDNVTLILNATSGAGHRWFIDYDNDANDDGSEPNSPAFDAGGAAISWNFTADRNGTYIYRSRGSASMWGLIIVGARGAGLPPAGVESTNLIVVGLVAALAAFALGLVVGRRTRMPPTPPPPPTAP